MSIDKETISSTTPTHSYIFHNYTYAIISVPVNVLQNGNEINVWLAGRPSTSGWRRRRSLELIAKLVNYFDTYHNDHFLNEIYFAVKMKLTILIHKIQIAWFKYTNKSLSYSICYTVQKDQYSQWQHWAFTNVNHWASWGIFYVFTNVNHRASDVSLPIGPRQVKG
jgi:hypothetical protein